MAWAVSYYVILLGKKIELTSSFPAVGAARQHAVKMKRSQPPVPIMRKVLTVFLKQTPWKMRAAEVNFISYPRTKNLRLIDSKLSTECAFKPELPQSLSG
jgi:hypothetical protein